MAEATKSGTGLSKNVAGALAYVLGPLTGVILLVMEKDPYVRFHAMQSIVVLGGLIVLGWVLPFTLILLPLAGLIWVVYVIMWLVLIYKAYQGVEWEVPVVGKFARQLLAKS